MIIEFKIISSQEATIILSSKIQMICMKVRGTLDFGEWDINILLS